MNSMLVFLSVATTVVSFINADVYLHMPRGSNNRLNEKSANRKNANRVFDSQVCAQNAFIMVIIIKFIEELYLEVYFVLYLSCILTYLTFDNSSKYC